MSLTCDDLIRFADVLEAREDKPDARQITYLRTYPVLRRLGRNESGDAEQDFSALAVAVYGWMPRVVRIKNNNNEKTIDVFSEARQLANPRPAQIVEIVEVMTDCLFSVVGASKLLHFANEKVFPIWDSRVAEVWSDISPSHYNMSKTQNYINYAQEVAELTGKDCFDEAYIRIQRAHSIYLERFGIREYKIGPLRAVEMAAFDRGGSGYDDL